MLVRPALPPELSALLKAARADDVDAQYKLGAYFARARDPQQALHWYRRAASVGHPDAQQALADTYLLGMNGIQKNLILANRAHRPGLPGR